MNPTHDTGDLLLILDEIWSFIIFNYLDVIKSVQISPPNTLPIH